MKYNRKRINESKARRSALTERRVIRKIAQIIKEEQENPFNLDKVDDYVEKYNGIVEPDGKKIAIGNGASLSFTINGEDLIVDLFKDGKKIDSITEEGLIKDRYDYPVTAARETAAEIINDNLDEIKE